MKFVWEEKDIRSGVRYTKPGITEVWMIGYLPEAELPSGRRHVSISMEDGMVTVPYSRSEMAADLTRNEYVPEKMVGLVS